MLVAKTGSTIAAGVQVRNLWRFILRAARALPQNERDYYLYDARANFKTHAEEKDPDIVKRLVEAGYANANWVIEYRVHGNYEARPHNPNYIGEGGGEVGIRREEEERDRRRGTPIVDEWDPNA